MPKIPRLLAGSTILLLSACAIGQGVVEPGGAAELSQARTILRLSLESAARLDEPSRTTLMRAIAQAEAMAGDASGALRTAEAIQDASDKGLAFLGIAAVQAHSGDRAGAAMTLQRAFQNWSAMPDEGVTFPFFGMDLVLLPPLKEVLLTRTVEKVLDAGDVTGALGIADVVPDPYYRASLLDMIAVWQGRAGDRAGAAVSHERALESAGTIQGRKRKASILWHIAGAWAQWGELQRAREIAGTIPDDTYGKDAAWLDIAAAQAKAGDIAGALTTITALPEGDVHGRVYISRAQGIERIAQAQAEAGDVPGALQTVGTIQDAGGRTRALGAIAKVQAEAGDVPGALQTVGTIPESFDQAWTLREIAKEQVKTGDPASARVLLKEALTTAGRIEGAQYRVGPLLAIAREQAEVGDCAGAAAAVQQALAAAQVVEDGSERTEAFWKIAAIQAKTTDLAGAAATMQQALEATQVTRYASTRVQALRQIAEAQAKGGDVSGALQTAAALGDSSDRFRAWRDIAEAQAKAEDVPGALQTASAINYPSDQARAWREIAKIQAKAEDVPDALTWAVAESQDLLKASALLGVAEGILERVQSFPKRSSRAGGELRESEPCWHR